MEKTQQQTIIGIESNKQIGVLIIAEDDGLRLRFDTEGKVTPSAYHSPSDLAQFGDVVFKRLDNPHPKYMLSDHGYFSPLFDERVIITIHVTETRRGTYSATFNAYKRDITRTKGIDPQYLGSKSVLVSI